MPNKPIILVVDDEPSNIAILTNTLSEQYDVRVAHNGERALKAAAKIPLDLILLDIQMPGMNGFEVAQKIRQQADMANVPIIFITGDKNEESILRGFEAGGNDYITKPFFPRELKARVHNHLQLRRTQKFLEMILNKQSNIVVLCDGVRGKFINTTGVHFFGYNDSDSFFRDVECVSYKFLPLDNYFHFHLTQMAENTSAAPDGQTWIDVFLQLPKDERHVAMRSAKGELRIFYVSIQRLPDPSLYVVDYIDVTESIHKREKLQDKLNQDSLTNALSRHYFDNEIDSILNSIATSGMETGIGFIDLDHFKQINDNYGHEIGDQVLQKFVEMVQKNCRQNDILIRWGGEEFILIVPVRDQAALQNILEKLRASVEASEFNAIKQLTCSIGGTLKTENENIRETIKRADEALYQAKTDGRNQVFVK